jgi:hypothetical protein
VNRGTLDHSVEVDEVVRNTLGTGECDPVTLTDHGLELIDRSLGNLFIGCFVLVAREFSSASIHSVEDTDTVLACLLRLLDRVEFGEGHLSDLRSYVFDVELQKGLDEFVVAGRLGFDLAHFLPPFLVLM